MIRKNFKSNDYRGKYFYKGELHRLKSQSKLQKLEVIALTRAIFFNLEKFTKTEFKVFMFIWLRTLGFLKLEETITYDEFIGGKKRNNGKSLVSGCAGSRSTVSKCLKSLEEKDFIEIKKVGKNIRSYRIKVNSITRVNEISDEMEREVRTRDSHINTDTAFRVLVDFLKANMSYAHGNDLKMYCLTWSQSLGAGNVFVLMKRKEFFKGRIDKRSGEWIFKQTGMSKATVYRVFINLCSLGVIGCFLKSNGAMGICCLDSDKYMHKRMQSTEIRAILQGYTDIGPMLKAMKVNPEFLSYKRIVASAKSTKKAA